MVGWPGGDFEECRGGVLFPCLCSFSPRLGVNALAFFYRSADRLFLFDFDFASRLFLRIYFFKLGVGAALVSARSLGVFRFHWRWPPASRGVGGAFHTRA